MELARTITVIEKGIAERVQIGAQLYISRGGEMIADIAIGDARPGVLMRPDTLMLWLSSAKPVTAVAIAQLWERRKLELDDRVAKHIPEFAAHEKDTITIRHILTHTAGFRAIFGKWEDQPWDSIVRAICDARLEPNWAPGQKAGYHPATSWYILGELIRRLGGRAFEDYVREEIFIPIGMNDSWFGMPPERYRAYGERIGFLHDTSKGEPRAVYESDTEAGAARPRPSGNAHGPIRELGFFYESLLTRATNILSPQAIEALTARHRVGMLDHTFKAKVDFGLGFIIDSKHYEQPNLPYGYGPHASRRTFGHGGHQSSCAFADPEHQLVVAWLMNGMPGEGAHQARADAINAAIYEDLGLAG